MKRRNVWWTLILGTVVVGGCRAAAAREARSEPEPGGLERAARVQEVVEAEGEWLGPSVWPGFRPDTVAMVYVVPEVGKLFVHHGETQPEGFHPYPRHPGWGWVGPEPVSFPRGRIAFQTVTMTAATLGLAIHEAFHEYQEQVAREGIAFGRRENALQVVSYPVFDVAMQSDLALEGALLGRALATEGEARREWAAEFLALRRARRAGMADRFVAFEQAAELNEGLAQYTLVKGLRELASRQGFPWSAEARAEAAAELDRLPVLLENSSRSVRRNFYTTGAALGLLLDDLAPGWKDRLMAEEITLESLLAEAVVGVEVADIATIRGRDEGRFREAAEEAVEALAAERTALRGSLLDRSGVAIELRAAPSGFDWCGFDPQNTLTTPDGEVLHTRWLRLCAAGTPIAEIYGGAVQLSQSAYVLVLADTTRITTEAGSWEARAGWPIGPVAGLRIATDDVTLDVPRAMLRLEEGRPVVVVQDTAPSWAMRVPPIDSLVTSAGQPPLWPGFRPDTIPMVYMVRGGGAVYLNPSDSLPAVFTSLPGIDGGWTTSSPFGALAGLRFTLTSVLPDASPASDAGLAVHEAFHGFQRVVRSPDRRFGSGEVPAGIREYPVFDAINISALAREGALLRQAVSAADRPAAEALAREFLAVRASRRNLLPDSLVRYERMAELNEGLAEYVRIRALDRWMTEAPAPHAARSAEERHELMSRLDTLHRVTDPRPRRIFYATGSGMGKVLDRLAPGWPARLVQDDLFLDELLARVVPGPSGTVSLAVDPEVGIFLEELKGRRIAAADSLLEASGLVVRIEWPAGAGFSVCGLDPLNVQPVGDGRVLHRFIRLCHDGDLLAAVGSPSVEDLTGRSITVPLDVEPAEAAVTVDGRALADWLEERTSAESITVNVGAVQIDAPVRRLTYDRGRLTAILTTP